MCVGGEASLVEESKCKGLEARKALGMFKDRKETIVAGVAQSKRKSDGWEV